MHLVPAAAHAGHWIKLRAALWPGDDHAFEVDRLIATRDPDKLALIALGDADRANAGATDQPLGLVEASLRHDYVNGCDGSPVLFLEGMYVVPAARRRGVARALCDAVAAWGCTRGASEFASDALLDNAASHAMHTALGFAETERVIYFRRLLVEPA